MKSLWVGSVVVVSFLSFLQCGKVDDEQPCFVDTDAKQDVEEPVDNCSKPSDCAGTSPGCCPPTEFCGIPTLSVRKDKLEIYRKLTCTEYTSSTCVDVCEPRNLYVRPTCSSAGKCELVDTSQNAITECKSDPECILRDNRCCGTCGSDNLIGIRADKKAEFEALVCDPGQVCPLLGCPEAPPNVRPACIAGRCQAVPIAK